MWRLFLEIRIPYVMRSIRTVPICAKFRMNYRLGLIGPWRVGCDRLLNLISPY